MRERLVIGEGSCKPADLAFMSIRVLDHVRSTRLTSLGVKLTHHPSGYSRYVTLRDRHGRDWLVRLSNHFRPSRRNDNPVPHFDLVSLDGRSGEAEVRAFIDRVDADQVAWVDPMEGVRQLRQRRRAR